MRPVPDPLEGTACSGLAGGWARRTANHQPVHAAQAAREAGPFYCAACHSEVKLRQGAERASHFAHEAERPAARGGAEGALHRACKAEIHAALAAEVPDGHWALERTIPARPQDGIGELRPDISGRVHGVRLAIEVQASALDIASVLQRTRSYARRRIPVLWVVPVPQQVADDELRPRLHERYFHSIYLGRTYYWWPGLGASVLPVHYASAMRRVPMGEWYQRGVGPVQVGGYETAYRSFKTPLCAPRLHIGRDFAPRWRGPFVPDNAAKAVPACQLWLDTLPPWW